MNTSPIPRSRLAGLLAAGGLAAALVLSSCGSDDASDDASAVSDAPAPDETSGATDAPVATNAPVVTDAPEATDPGDEFDVEAACAAWIDADTAVTQFLFSGQGDADSVNATLDAAIEAADPANLETLTALKESAQGQLADPESDASEETLTLYGDAITWSADCPGVDTLDITATEYHYDGIPETLTAGYKVLSFANEGNEFHEMFTFRIKDGVTDTVEEIVALPEEEAMTKVTPVNVSFAPPGTTTPGSWNLAEPGRYAALCFIPVGTTPAAEGSGPPHFTEGMVHEFTVT